MNVGIDFGTTNSSIAFQRSMREAPECASVEDYRTQPFDAVLRTAALLDQFGRLVPGAVGAAAVDPVQWIDPRTRTPRRVIQQIKPFLSTFRLREQWPVQRTRIDLESYDYGRQEPMVVRFTDLVQSGDMRCSRDELMTAAIAVFQRLFEKTPKTVLQQDPRIVIGVPLIFPDYAKKRLISIIAQSGIVGRNEPYREALRRVRFLPEPVAASLLYATDCQPPRGKSTGRVLIFDSGGGTLDLALLEFATIDGEYRPIRQLALNAKAIAGSCYDEVIVHSALKPLQAAVRRWTGEAEGKDEVARWHLNQAAESIKVALSTREEHEEISLMPAGVRPRVSRSDFERWAAPLLDDTERLVRETVKDIQEVDSVVMVGGSSLIPCVQERLRRIFPQALVVHEDPRQTGRGEGVERALTAVSKGMALYDESVSRQGITPFSYGFWDPTSGKTVVAVPKWSAHTTERPVVAVPVRPGAIATTLTLVQELVEPERILNVLNVPVLPNGATPRVYARVRTSDGELYPDIEVLDQKAGKVVGTFRVGSLNEAVLKDLIINDDHAVRWSGSKTLGFDTPFPEVVTLRKGDPVVFTQDAGGGRRNQCNGTIEKIRKISDGLFYDEVGHWDLTRWRFDIRVSEHGVAPFVPQRETDIRLDRRRGRDRRRDVAEQ